MSKKTLLLVLTLMATTVIAQGSGINLSASDARIITDNEESYRSKINIINNAKKSLKLMYYIYAEDESSSYLTKRLIEKAKDGVEIEILVDFLTNLTHFDLFKIMETEGKDKRTGKQNIHVRFYNRPTPVIIRDVTFMTSTCRQGLAEKDCRAERTAQANVAYNEAVSAHSQGLSAKLPVLTSAFLAGVYSKNLATVKTSLALGTGNDIEQVKKALAANPKKMSAEEVARLKTLLKLLFDAKVKGSVSAKLQLALAMSAHGAEIQPIMDMIDKVIPDTMKDDVENPNDWIHLTDFLHHKLLLADGEVVQMGGRNIENSYHLNTKLAITDKYIFRDTDFVMQLKSKNEQLVKTFDNLFNFKTMVSTTKDIEIEMNYEYAKKAPQLGQALMLCVSTQGNNVAGCLEAQSKLIITPDQKRIAEARQNLESKAKSPKVAEILNAPSVEQIHEAIGGIELYNASIEYLQNNPYLGDNPQVRLSFQKEALEQSKQAKGIHQAIEEGINNVCGDAERRFKEVRIENRKAYLENPANKRRIVLNQGYVIFSGEILRLIGSAVAKTAVNADHRSLKCPGVTFEILTNSVDTTDLSPINLFASTQISSLLNEQRKSQEFYDVEAAAFDPYKLKNFFPPAKIEYYEFQAPSEKGTSLESLHTKVFVLGQNDIIVGSANADVRSYFMDTNNAVLIKSVPNFITRYLNWVDSQKIPSKKPFFGFGNDQMIKIAQDVEGQSSEQRLKTLEENFYKPLMTKAANAYKLKWLNQAGGVETPEYLKKKQELEEHLPSFIKIVTQVNNRMYNLSQTIINDELNITEAEMQKRMHQLNLVFEIL